MNRVCWLWMALLIGCGLSGTVAAADETFRQGVNALQAQDYELALSCFHTVLQANPDLATAYDARGLAYAGKQAFDLAIADHTEAIRRSPRTAGPYYNRGNARFAQKDYAAAVADFTQALDINPNYAEAYNNRGLAHAARGDFQQAIDDHAQAIRLDPAHASTLYLNRGLAYLGARAYENARADFAEAIRIDPGLTSAHSHRGTACARKKEFDQASADYTEALRLEPNAAGVWNNRGNVHICRKEYDQAIDDYTEAILLDPQAGVYFNRGLAHAANKDYDRALADYDEAVRRDPALAKAGANPGLAYIGPSLYYGKDMVTADGRTPSYLEAFYYRGNARLGREEFDLAIADYTAAVRLASSDPRPLTNRAAAYVGNREYDRARDDFTALTRLDPNSADAYYRRGQVWLLEKEFDQAVADFSEAISLDPNHTAAYQGRARAWTALRRPDKAQVDNQKALRGKPQQEGSLAAASKLDKGVAWRQFAQDLPVVATPVTEERASSPVATQTPAEIPDVSSKDAPQAEPTIVPAVAWMPAVTSAELHPTASSPEPAPTPPATVSPLARPIFADASVPAQCRTSTELNQPLAPTAPPPPSATVAALPPERYARAEDFWYSPAPMFYAVVLAALVIGAGIVCIPLLFLLPRLTKPAPEVSEVHELIRVLLLDRGAGPWQRGLPAVMHGAPPPVPPRIEPSTPARPIETFNPEADLIQNILEDNLRLRDDEHR
ncbi:hypothetical protein AYO44_10835 [Planctomycetaceae bacterium SCGC AG-212-F19]|nr:hypothetical protein AYO44_10835 [Planctomycetaceae bacterium SCGC AG-212-F19]